MCDFIFHMQFPFQRNWIVVNNLFLLILSEKCGFKANKKKTLDHARSDHEIIFSLIFIKVKLFISTPALWFFVLVKMLTFLCWTNNSGCNYQACNKQAAVRDFLLIMNACWVTEGEHKSCKIIRKRLYSEENFFFFFTLALHPLMTQRSHKIKKNHFFWAVSERFLRFSWFKSGTSAIIHHNSKAFIWSFGKSQNAEFFI